jgi:hypothetical protein
MSQPRNLTVAAETLHFLLSSVYAGELSPLHRADLEKSGLTDATIQAQKIRSIPPDAITPLLGFDTPRVTSAMLIPFPAPADPAGGWMPHVRMKIFPAIVKESGAGKQKTTSTIKYLQPRASGTRLFFPLATIQEVCAGTSTLYVCEGEKKGLALAQTGRPTLAICGVENWHHAGHDALIEDFDHVNLAGRVVKVIPDGDVETNESVRKAVLRFGVALERRGAQPRLVHLNRVLDPVKEAAA